MFPNSLKISQFWIILVVSFKICSPDSVRVKIVFFINRACPCCFFFSASFCSLSTSAASDSFRTNASTSRDWPGLTERQNWRRALYRQGGHNRKRQSRYFIGGLNFSFKKIDHVKWYENSFSKFCTGDMYFDIIFQFTRSMVSNYK